MNDPLFINGITLSLEAETRKWALEQTKHGYRELDVSAWIKAAEELVAYVKSGKQPS